MINIVNLTKKYGDMAVLCDTSYTFPATGLVCIMGASGGGKTTLLNLIAGFDSDFQGEIVAGKSALHSMNEDELCRYRRDNIGFIFQNYHLLSGYTVLENIMLACEQNGSGNYAEMEKIAINLLQQVDLSEKINEQIQNLSGGQKQRVAIVRALINDPPMILADEPTGALDRGTSNEIMKLLSGISAKKLVIVITHDKKICEFADEIIHISNKQIAPLPNHNDTKSGNSGEAQHKNSAEFMDIIVKEKSAVNCFNRARKNFSVHLARYVAVSLAIAISMLAFLFSLSFGNVTARSIDEFKQKNTAFNNGYIKRGDAMEMLGADLRTENVYYQYKLSNITVKYDETAVLLAEKLPMPKSSEQLSYGIMPKIGENQIAITASLAKQLGSNIADLIGKNITLEYQNQQFSLNICGIFNAGYDDIIVSSDVEQQLYKDISAGEHYSISYDVTDFNDIISVSEKLKSSGFDVTDASNEVGALQNTFAGLSKLFMIVSILVMCIGLFICSILFYKLQNSRYKEIGLLSALGFSKRHIAAMIRGENLLTSIFSSVVTLVLVGAAALAGTVTNFPFIVNILQVAISIISTFAIILVVSMVSSHRLLNTQPAEALRK